MKVLCLIDSVVKPGDRWLWNYLPANDDDVDFVFTTATDRFAKWGKVLGYYPTFWRLAFQAWRKTQHSDYDLVVAWEGKNGFPYSLLRSLLGQKAPPLVILAFSYRGLIRHFEALTRFGLRSVDHLQVLTNQEAEDYQRRFSLAPHSVSVCPLGWYDTHTLPQPRSANPEDKFILASGRSYRDYATLAQAVKGLDMKVVVLGRQFNLNGVEFPTNVQTRDLLPTNEFWALLHQAQFVVVPLQPVPHATGDGHLVQAMSAGKAVVATRGPSSEMYVQEGKTGLLVPPSDAEAMRAAILQLWNNPDEAAAMGQRARQRYEAEYTLQTFAARTYATLLDVHHRSGASAHLMEATPARGN